MSCAAGDFRVNWRYHHTLLAAACLANFSNNASRLVISPLIPNIIDAFEVSKSSVGLALTGMWAVYALLQFPSDILADRFGEYQIIVVSFALTGVASLFLTISPNFPLFGAFVVFLGAGTGLYFVVGTSMLAKEFRQCGQVLGLHSARGPAAGFVAPAVAAFIGINYGWRPVLLLGAALSIPLLVMFLCLIKPVNDFEEMARPWVSLRLVSWNAPLCST